MYRIRIGAEVELDTVGLDTNTESRPTNFENQSRILFSGHDPHVARYAQDNLELTI
jgi:hypothetical protein